MALLDVAGVYFIIIQPIAIGAAHRDGSAGRQADYGLWGRGTVTDTGHEILGLAVLLGLGQFYQDRAAAVNAFDELKNQWGYGGFTTRDRVAASFRPGRGIDLQWVEPACSPG